MNVRVPRVGFPVYSLYFPSFFLFSYSFHFFRYFLSSSSVLVFYFYPFVSRFSSSAFIISFLVFFFFFLFPSNLRLSLSSSFLLCISLLFLLFALFPFFTYSFLILHCIVFPLSLSTSSSLLPYSTFLVSLFLKP